MLVLLYVLRWYVGKVLVGGCAWLEGGLYGGSSLGNRSWLVCMVCWLVLVLLVMRIGLLCV